jgi:riboflavin kinase/FMN adenylyltransferase
MEIHRDFSRLSTIRNAVITIGSFDGLHSGHQMIIRRLNKLARKHKGESVVITFHPHPRQVLFPDDHSLRLLSTQEEKALLLDKLNVDHLVFVPFTKAFSQQSPDEYIQDFLINQFHPRCIVIGYDHRFGKGRKGDIEYLKKHAEKGGFEVVEIPKQEIEDIAVSSTKIRNALHSGKVYRANQLLQHHYQLSGTVVKGQQIGNELGFPTANISVADPYKLIPADGIYAVRVIHKEQIYGGMLYIGTRPTLEAYNDRNIEVNIFDFSQRIYGEQLTLIFVDRIREDTRFNNLDELREQLKQDKLDSLSTLQKKTTFTSTAVVILNYNGKSWLEKFLPPLFDHTGPEAKIIVADNCSTDDSTSFLRNNFPEVEIIELERNFGFAEGYNRAIEQIEEPYTLLLNSDVEVSPGWLSPLVELLESDKSIAAVQPRIRSYIDKHLFEYAGAAGGWIDHLGYPFCRGRIFGEVEEDRNQYNQPAEIFWASGAAMLIRTDLFRNMGGFDGSYFAHLEEIDLCWRLKRAGYKLMVQPESLVYHVGGGTLGYLNARKTYLNFRNSLYTLFKNKSTATLLWLIPLRLVLDGLAAGLFLYEGKFKHILAILRAHFHFYKNLPALSRRRKLEKKNIELNRISKGFNDTGMYRKSIVWAFYAGRKKRFGDIVE